MRAARPRQLSWWRREKSGYSRIADILPIMDPLDVVTRVQEEKQNRVSLHIESSLIDNSDYIQGGTTKVEEGLNRVEAEQ